MQNKSVLRLVVAVLALITLTFTARVDGQMSPSLLTPGPPLSPGSPVRSPDSGAEYNVACDALHNVSALALASDGSLFAGTWCGGIWRLPAQEEAQ